MRASTTAARAQKSRRAWRRDRDSAGLSLNPLCASAKRQSTARPRTGRKRCGWSSVCARSNPGSGWEHVRATSDRLLKLFDYFRSLGFDRRALQNGISEPPAVAGGPALLLGFLIKKRKARPLPQAVLTGNLKCLNTFPRPSHTSATN